MTNPFRCPSRRPSAPRALSRSLPIVLAALACAFAAPVRAQDSTTQPGFTPAWNRSVESLINLAISPQGDYLGLITTAGKLALWNANAGKSIWSTGGIAGHDLAVADAMGGYVLVYDQLNRIDRSVSFYRSPTTLVSTPAEQAATTPQPTKPLRVMKRTLDGAIWSVAISHDGSHAAIGTGSRQVYLVDLRLHPKLAAHPVDGICNEVQFSGNNQYVAIGLWDQSGVETMDMAGRIRWSYLASRTRRYSVSISPDSRRVLAVSYLNPQWSAPVLSLFNDQGVMLWSLPLGSGVYFGPDPAGAPAKLGTASQVSFASYTATVQHGHAIAPERSLVAIGPTGERLWTKGGLFFAPRLLCLAPGDSGAVAYDENIKTLYRITDEGQIVARARLSGNMRFFVVSQDRQRLVIYTDDGELTTYKVH